MINNFFYKKKFLLLIVFFFYFADNVYASINSNILLKVDNEIITNFDLEFEIKYLKALNQDLKSINKNKLLEIAKDSLVKEIIKKNELKKYYDLSKGDENYINQVIESLLAKLNIDSEENFKKYLKEYDLTIDEVKKKIRIEAIWNEFIFNKFKNQIDIDADKLKKQVNLEIKNKKKIKNTYLLSEILFNVDNEENLTEKYNKIKNEISKIGFKNAANIYSISDTAKFGGTIGWVNETRLSNLILNKIKNLKINEITKPINIPGGQLILKLNDKKQIKINLDFNKLLNQRISFEQNRQLNQFSMIFFQKLKYNASISE